MSITVEYTTQPHNNNVNLVKATCTHLSACPAASTSHN